MFRVLILGMIVGACATSSQSPKSDEYLRVIEETTESQIQYDGLANTMDLHATLLNSHLRNLQLELKSYNLKWDEPTRKKEEEKDIQFRNASTEVFLSFFTPNRKHNNLANRKSLWKVFLDVDGHRYTADLTEDRTVVEELQQFYPYHSRWSTPYVARFSVPTSATEANSATLIVTGNLGSASVVFSPNRDSVTP